MIPEGRKTSIYIKIPTKNTFKISVDLTGLAANSPGDLGGRRRKRRRRRRRRIK